MIEGVGSDQTFIEIPRWRKLRHYRNRRTVWVKLHTQLLHSDQYLQLTPLERAALHGIWLAYAETDGDLPATTSSLSRRFGFRLSSATLRALVDAGFIAVRASKVRVC